METWIFLEPNHKQLTPTFILVKVIQEIATSSLLPIVAACAGEKSVSEEVSALYFHIVLVEEPITAAEYKILYDRTRLTLQVRLVHVQPPVLQLVLA